MWAAGVYTSKKVQKNEFLNSQNACKEEVSWHLHIFVVFQAKARLHIRTGFFTPEIKANYQVATAFLTCRLRGKRLNINTYYFLISI